MRRSPLLPKPAPNRYDEPGAREFKTTRTGNCPVCGQRGTLLRHHVISERDVRIAKGNPWSLANSMWIGVYCRERCHRRHHSHFRKIPLALVPAEAVEFAVELLGAEQAADYLARHYR